MVRRRRHRKRAAPGASGAGSGSGLKETKASRAILADLNRAQKAKRVLTQKKEVLQAKLLRGTVSAEELQRLHRAEAEARGERVPPEGESVWTKQPPPNPKIKDYSAISLKFNEPIQLTSNNFVIRMKVDLRVVKPLEPLPEPEHGVKSIRTPQKPEERQNVEIVVEYNPLGWPSKRMKKKAKKVIHVQTEGRAKQKVAFVEEDFWTFVRFVQAIHSPPEKAPEKLPALKAILT